MIKLIVVDGKPEAIYTSGKTKHEIRDVKSLDEIKSLVDTETFERLTQELADTPNPEAIKAAKIANINAEYEQKLSANFEYGGNVFSQNNGKLQSDITSIVAMIGVAGIPPDSFPTGLTSANDSVGHVAMTGTELIKLGLAYGQYVADISEEKADKIKMLLG